jgi:hypothetical protein
LFDAECCGRALDQEDLSLEPTNSARPEQPARTGRSPFVQAEIFGLTYGQAAEARTGKETIKVGRVVSGDGGIGRPI